MLSSPVLLGLWAFRKQLQKSSQVIPSLWQQPKDSLKVSSFVSS